MHAHIFPHSHILTHPLTHTSSSHSHILLSLTHLPSLTHPSLTHTSYSHSHILLSLTHPPLTHTSSSHSHTLPPTPLPPPNHLPSLTHPPLTHTSSSHSHIFPGVTHTCTYVQSCRVLPARTANTPHSQSLAPSPPHQVMDYSCARYV